MGIKEKIYVSTLHHHPGGRPAATRFDNAQIQCPCGESVFLTVLCYINYFTNRIFRNRAAGPEMLIRSCQDLGVPPPY